MRWYDESLQVHENYDNQLIMQMMISECVLKIDFATERTRTQELEMKSEEGVGDYALVVQPAFDSHAQ